MNWIQQTGVVRAFRWQFTFQFQTAIKRTLSSLHHRNVYTLLPLIWGSAFTPCRLLSKWIDVWTIFYYHTPIPLQVLPALNNHRSKVGAYRQSMNSPFPYHSFCHLLPPDCSIWPIQGTYEHWLQLNIISTNTNISARYHSLVFSDSLMDYCCWALSPA